MMAGALLNARLMLAAIVSGGATLWARGYVALPDTPGAAFHAHYILFGAGVFMFCLAATSEP